MMRANDRLSVDPVLVDFVDRVTGEADMIVSDNPTQSVFYLDNETRFIFDEMSFGWIRMSKSLRNGPASFVCEVAVMDYASRYLAMLGGSYFRMKKRLERLTESLEARSVAPGVRIEHGTIQLNGLATSIESVVIDGQPVARFPAPALQTSSAAAGASWFLSYSVEQIISAQMNPEGKPLFSVRPQMRGRE